MHASKRKQGVSVQYKWHRATHTFQDYINMLNMVELPINVVS